MHKLRIAIVVLAVVSMLLMSLPIAPGEPAQSTMEQADQTPFAAKQFVPDQASWPGGNGQEQIGGDYQAGYAAGYQAGYAQGWWEGAQATVQLLLKYISSLQDMNVALSEFHKNGIVHPGGPTVQEGPKIKQAVD